MKIKYEKLNDNSLYEEYRYYKEMDKAGELDAEDYEIFNIIKAERKRRGIVDLFCGMEK